MTTSSIESGSRVEESYDQKDTKTEIKNKWFHAIHKTFSKHDHSQPNGHPHIIIPWLAGQLTNLGFRRK